MMPTAEELQQFEYDMQVLKANKQGDIETLKVIFAQHLDVHYIDTNSKFTRLHIAIESATPIETLQF